MQRLALPLVLLALQGCDVSSDPLAHIDLAGPPIDIGLDLETELLSPGRDASFTMSGMTPGASGFLLGSTIGTGTGTCPGALGGACIDLVRPFFLGSAVANATGVATFEFTVPANAPVGLLPCFQGAEIVPGQPADLSIPACSYVAPCSITDVTVDFTDLGSFQSPTVLQEGLEVTGSNNVNVLNFNGLGIVGGASNTVVDGTESISIRFVDGPKTNVRYFVNFAGNGNGDSTVGDRTVQAFADGGGSFTPISQTSTGTSSVSADPADDVASFTVTAQVDSFRIANVTYEDCL